MKIITCKNYEEKTDINIFTGLNIIRMLFEDFDTMTVINKKDLEKFKKFCILPNEHPEKYGVDDEDLDAFASKYGFVDVDGNHIPNLIENVFDCDLRYSGQYGYRVYFK